MGQDDGARAVRAGGRHEDLEVQLAFQRVQVGLGLVRELSLALGDELDRLQQRHELVAGRNAEETDGVVAVVRAQDGDGRDLVDMELLGQGLVADEVAHFDRDLVGQLGHFLGDLARLRAHLALELLGEDQQLDRAGQIAEHFADLFAGVVIHQRHGGYSSRY